MAIQWIVMDMDGTLLNKQSEISSYTKETLMKCQEKGLKLILASGRSRFRLFKYADELQLANYEGMLIEVNGMAYYDVATAERTFIRRLNRCDIELIFNTIKEYGAEVQGYLDNAVYDYIPVPIFEKKKVYAREKNLPEDYPWTGGAFTWLADSRDGYPYIHYIHKVEQLPYELNKFILIDEIEHITNIFEDLNQKIGDLYELVRTCPRTIEITPKGVTKGRTLLSLMEAHHISSEEVMAFGDGENDVDMFSVVKYGIAMGNAADYVKEKAFDVTADHQADGIAVAIRKYCPEIFD